jgi:hypothetical protein
MTKSDPAHDSDNAPFRLRLTIAALTLACLGLAYEAETALNVARRAGQIAETAVGQTGRCLDVADAMLDAVDWQNRAPVCE